MAELKTQPTKQSVARFINAIGNPEKRKDAKTLLQLFKEVTGEKPVLWGSSIVGFGKYHYKYKSGREADWMLTGFSPRAKNFSLYIMPGFKSYAGLLDKVGPHSIGSSCLYINDLSKIHMPTLKKLIAESVKEMKGRYPKHFSS